MFERGAGAGGEVQSSPALPAGVLPAGAPAAGVLSTGELGGLVARLAALDPDVGDAERVEQIRALEELKSAAAAAQARVAAAFAGSQRAAQRAAGVPAARARRGIAAQVGLARRQSPASAARYTGWAQVLVGELPATLAALGRGEIPEWRALLVARETAWLSREHRAAVDQDLAGRLAGLGDRGTEAAARRAAYRLDPAGFLARAAAAEADRRVSLRPAPETMARVSALLPVAQGVGVYAALTRAAEAACAGGDPRGRGQLMADVLVERVTGQAHAGAVPVEIQLVMTDTTLFTLSTPGDGDHPAAGSGPGGAGGAGEPAELLGYGPIPAGLARRLVAAADQHNDRDSDQHGDRDRAEWDAAAVWVRRLYTSPDSGALVGVDSARRCFPAGLRRLLVLRDRTCRTRWCDAPIRHADHVLPAAAGGATSAHNGQGLCEGCNYARQAPGWRAAPGPGGAGREVTTTTPTGHTYTSRPPDPPRVNAYPPIDRGGRAGGPPQRAGPAPPDRLPEPPACAA